MDVATDEEIARLLAEEQAAYYGFDVEDAVGEDEDDESDPDFGAGKRKKKSTKKGVGKKSGANLEAPEKDINDQTAKAGEEKTSIEGDDAKTKDEQIDHANGVETRLSSTGRRKRRDTGRARNQSSRPWTDDEETLFQEALEMYGRDWKKCGEHIGSRDHRAVASHCQKYLIKQLLKGEELPAKMRETGRGYTLSGRPLDPNSAAARAYGLRPALFREIVESGFLEVGVHVTTLEVSDTIPSARSVGRPTAQREKGSKKSAKRARKSGAGHSYSSDEEISSDEEEAACRAIDAKTNAAFVVVFDSETEQTDSIGHPLGVRRQTEYSRSRPRRQTTGRAHLGNTTESLDLTMLQQFVGSIGSGGAQSQPFTVQVAPEALLVMDFHAHLSSCEIIGLLGGTFNEADRSLSVRAAFPCRRAYGSDSGTSVELDAEWQFEVTIAMSAAGMVPVGWYHSHPIFEPRPSAKDNENQRNYQALCRLDPSGLEPWVGAIVSPYDQALPTTQSGLQFWVVRQRERSLTPYHVRVSKLPITKVPEAGDDLEKQIVCAIDLHKEDFGRVNLHEIWRPFVRIMGGYKDGPPVSYAAKLAAALKAHLPSSMESKGDIERFFRRISRRFKDSWDVDVDLLGALDCTQSSLALQQGPSDTGAPKREQTVDEGMRERGDVESIMRHDSENASDKHGTEKSTDPATNQEVRPSAHIGNGQMDGGETGTGGNDSCTHPDAPNRDFRCLDAEIDTECRISVKEEEEISAKDVILPPQEKVAPEAKRDDAMRSTPKSETKEESQSVLACLEPNDVMNMRVLGSKDNASSMEMRHGGPMEGDVARIKWAVQVESSRSEDC